MATATLTDLDDATDEAAEQIVCNGCGQWVDFHETRDDLCEECHEVVDAADLAIEEAESGVEEAKDEVARLVAELSEARAALRAAKKALAKARDRREYLPEI